MGRIQFPTCQSSGQAYAQSLNLADETWKRGLQGRTGERRYLNHLMLLSSPLEMQPTQFALALQGKDGLGSPLRLPSALPPHPQ